MINCVLEGIRRTSRCRFLHLVGAVRPSGTEWISDDATAENVAIRKEEWKRRRKETWDRFVKLGSKFQREDNTGKLPVVEGVGYCDGRMDSRTGKVYTTVYPSMRIRKTPLPLANVKLEPAEKSAFRVAQKQPSRVHAFMEGLPRPLAVETKVAPYYFEDGQRKVKPYYYVFDEYFHADPPSGRRTVGQYFKHVMPDIPREWIEFRILQGMVFVNFEPVVSYDHPLVKDDFLCSLTHFHERPVLDEAIDVIHEDREMLVVNKPASMMIYPSTGYRLNSVMYILANELGHRNLRPVHRLDKLTSGVLIFAKCNEFTGVNKLQETFRSSSVSGKEYVALVDGTFPHQQLECSEPIASFRSKHGTTRQFRQGPKECSTAFRLLRTFDDLGCSLVRCLPKQGRTHQIRIHLSALGHPIVNDPLYNERESGRWRNTRNAVAEEGIDRVLRGASPRKEERPRRRTTQDPFESWKLGLARDVGKPDETCFECRMARELDKVQADDLMFICLHSWKYRLAGRTFEAPWPAWGTSEEFVRSLVAKIRT